MKKILVYLLLFAALLTYSAEASGQEKIIIYGIVQDNNGAGLRLATISLLHAKDSSLVKADLSGENGEFELIAASAGSYLLGYSATGFETRLTHPFELKAGQSFNAPAVALQILPRQLQQVTVTSRKQLIQVKPDKTVFNVQNSINATGSNALELLQKSPGVVIDNNDNISVKGKLGVKVYLDGRMIQLGPEDLAAYLKSINSNDIEAIEMIHNPGARYDASGNAGVINIRLRKNNSMGTNGSITAGWVQGITPKTNEAVSFNYRNKKINIFSNAGSSTGRYETDIIAPRVQKDTMYDQRLLQVSRSQNYTIKAGADYFISDKQTIGIMNTSGYSKDDWISYGNTAIHYQPTGDYIKRLKATNEVPRKRTSSNTNLNYRYADTSGREINLDADYGLYRGRAKSYQPNYYIDKDDNLMAEVITRNNTPTDIDIYTGKLDVTLPKWRGKLSFGAKYSFVKTKNILDFFNENNGAATKVADRSYDFVYKENVNAVYLSYQRSIHLKWTLQAGIRAEQTNSEGILTRGDGVVQPDQHVKRDYLDLFPNVAVSWTADQKNSFNISYGRRVDRPNYQGLNPFEVKMDELTYVKGNSFLRPQYTDNVELAYTRNNKITATLGYSYVKDFATQTVDTLNNYTYALARNLATQKITNFSISAPLTISKWWNGFVNVWANYQVFSGKVNDSYVDLNMAGYGAFTQHSLTLGKDYTAEISGWFNGPSALGPTLKAKAMGAMDIGLQKLLLQKKATLKVSVTDIFRSSVPFSAKTDFGGLLLKFWVTRESQTARISFTYRFGSNTVKAARQRQSGLETETKRIKEN